MYCSPRTLSFGCWRVGISGSSALRSRVRLFGASRAARCSGQPAALGRPLARSLGLMLALRVFTPTLPNANARYHVPPNCKLKQRAEVQVRREFVHKTLQIPSRRHVLKSSQIFRKLMQNCERYEWSATYPRQRCWLMVDQKRSSLRDDKRRNKAAAMWRAVPRPGVLVCSCGVSTIAARTSSD